MSTDPTEHAPPLEPTTPAIYNHYDINPYASAGLPPLPPPPPKQRDSKGWVIAPICIVLLMVAGGTLYYLMYRSVPQTPIQARAKVTPVPTQAPTPTPTMPLTVTPDMTATCATGAGCGGGGQAIPDYTVTDILGDFQRDGCPCGYGITYGETVWTYSGNNYFVSVHATSSAVWLDPPQTSGSAVIGLWVYNSPDNAQSAFAQVGNDENLPDQGSPISEAMKPGEYLHGRCLLLLSGYDSNAVPWSGYRQTLDNYCI